MKTFYTSDLHLSHANIIIYCKRPQLQEGDLVPCERRGYKWASRDIAMSRVAEMDEMLISIWNATVRPQDEVCVLGDFMMTSNLHRIGDMLSRLNGTKHLIVGNHDPKIGKCKTIEGWRTVRKQGYTRIAGRDIFMSHHKKYEYGEQWMLHGHSHNVNAYRGGRHIDVGVDGNEYVPYQEDELAAIIEANS